MEVRPAALRDAGAILGLRAAAECWLARRGIEQWHPGEVSLADVEGQVRAREWHVAAEAGVMCGALRLLWSDLAWAGHRPQRHAAYVHGLVIDREQAGRGLGTALLDWAAARGREAGAAVLRLDCVEGNLGLRRYYARCGFRQVGRRDFDGPWHSVVLLERAIAH